MSSSSAPTLSARPHLPPCLLVYFNFQHDNGQQSRDQQDDEASGDKWDWAGASTKDGNEVLLSLTTDNDDKRSSGAGSNVHRKQQARRHRR